MPDQQTKFTTKNFSQQLQSIQQIELENGWQQIQFKSLHSIQLSPGSSLLIENSKLPILWQIDDHHFFCIKPPTVPLLGNNLWQQFSVSFCKPKQSSIDDADVYILECQGAGLFAAIHQIYCWRQSNDVPEELILIADSILEPAFKLQPSRIYSSLFPADVTASLALFDDWKLLARFVNSHWQPGCYQGKLKQLRKLLEMKLQDKSIRRIQFASADCC